jgi:DNA-binding FadR family transcriptional regulator
MRTLGRDIVRGVYPPDQPFPIEQSLSESHSLSRSTVREAVKLLAGKGLVTSRPKIGIRVRPRHEWNLLDSDVLDWTAGSPNPHFLIELLQMRRAVEPEAAALVAANGNRELIATIEAAFQRMVAASEGLDDPLESDVAFHCAILTASENGLFAQLANLVRTALRSTIKQTNRAAGVVIGDLDDHKRILDAIVKGDTNESRKAAIALVDGAIELARRSQSDS